MKTYSQTEKQFLLSTLFEQLPLTERTLLKHRSQYGALITNDTGEPCLYRVIVEGVEIGAVRYYKGRRLCAYEIA